MPPRCITPRGSSVSEAVTGAAIGRFGGGRSNPPFIPLVRATSGAWHVTPGIAKWSKRRRHSLLQGVGAPRGKPVPRDRRARLVERRGAILADWQSAQRWNAPRSSTAVSPFAGRSGTEDLSGWRIAFARYVNPVRAGNAEGAQPSSSRDRTHDNGVRGRFEEGTCALKGAQAFARVGRSTEPVHLRMHVDLVARRSRRPARGGKGRT